MLMRLVMAGRLDHPRERCLFSNLSNIVSKLLTPVYHQTVRDEIVLPDRQVHRQRARQINKYAATAVTVVQRLVWPISKKRMTGKSSWAAVKIKDVAEKAENDTVIP